MSIRRRGKAVGTLVGGDLAIDIDHSTDSITLGDETNKLSFVDVSGTKCLPITVLSTVSMGGQVDSAAYTAGASTFSAVGGAFDDVSPDALAEGEMGIARMTSARALHVYVAGQAAGASGLTDTELRATAVPVSLAVAPTTPVTGTFWQATQPVSGTFWQTTQPVSGTFWQTTQPVSGTVAVTGVATATAQATQLTALQLLDDVIIADNAVFTDGTTKVSMSGHIFDETAGTALTENDAAASRIDSKRAQVFVLEDATTRGRRTTVSAGGAVLTDGSATTQPVSGAFFQATQPVSGTFWQATQPVSGTVTINAIPAGTNNIGDVDVLSLPPLPAGTNNIGYVDVLSLPTLPAGTNNIGDVDVLTLPALPTGSNVIGKVSMVDVAGNSCMDETNDALRVAIVSGAGSGGTAMADEAAFTLATTSFTPTGGVAQTGVGDALLNGNAGAFAMTLTRDLHVNLRNNAGAELTTFPVTGTFWQATQPVSGAFFQATQPVSGTVAFSNTTIAVTNVGTFAVQDSEKIADNAAFTDGTTKVNPVGFIYDEVAGTALTENDIGAARMNVNRSLIGIIEDGVTRARYATVTAANALKVDASATTQPVSGTFWQATQPVSGTFFQATQPISSTAANAKVDVGLINAVVPLMGNGITGTGSQRVTIASDNTAFGVIATGPAAHDAAVSGNPVRVAGRAMLANGTAVAEDGTVDLAADNQGRQIVTMHAPRDLIAQANGSQATTTEATMLAAGGAGVFHDMTKLILTNSNTTTACRVQIRDVTAGTVILEMSIAANGGAVVDFGSVPMKQTTANSAWTIDLFAAVADIYWFIQCVKRIA